MILADIDSQNQLRADLSLCLGRDSNSHVVLATQVFETCASTDSATQAYKRAWNIISCGLGDCGWSGALYSVETDAVTSEDKVYLSQRTVSVFGYAEFGGNLLTPL
jgi:hypothetical protein